MSRLRAFVRGFAGVFAGPRDEQGFETLGVMVAIACLFSCITAAALVWASP